MEDIIKLVAERYLDVKTAARLKSASRHLNACITEQVLHHALASSLWRERKEKALLFLWREVGVRDLRREVADRDRLHKFQAPEKVAPLVAVNKILVVWGARAATPYQIPLKGAAAVGSVEAVNMLLDHGAKLIDEYYKGYDPFYNREWGFCLRDLGEFTYGREKDVLWFAAKNGHYDVVKILLDREVDAVEKITSLWCAIRLLERVGSTYWNASYPAAPTPTDAR